MSIRPVFYDSFRCRADRCAHSCCRGWEIDVDPDSAELYRRLPGALGETLRGALYEDEEGWHFRLDARDRCPLLRPDGLCRLIAELGEAALCDICALHPRFFEEAAGQELAGLGLSCEAVCSLLCEQEGPLLFVTDGGERLSFAALLRRLCPDFPEELLKRPGPPDARRAEAALEALALTEPIDARWPLELEQTRRRLPELLARSGGGDAALWGRIRDYILFRQLERLGETRAGDLAAWAELSLDWIRLRWPLEGEEALRRWSEQIEYSTENIDRMLKYLS